MSDATHAHVGICSSCGKMFAASVDLPEYRKQNAKFVADIVRRGHRLGHVLITEVRSATWCDCHKSEQKAPAQADAFASVAP